MQPKKHTVKKLFSKEKPGNRKNKKSDRPWVMQYKWLSEEHFRRLSWLQKYNPDWITYYDKYTDVDHALQQLSKELRSFFKEKFAGREIRLYNKDTGEILPLCVRGTKMLIDND